MFAKNTVEKQDDNNYYEQLEKCPVCGKTTKMKIVRDFLEAPWIVDCVCKCDETIEGRRQKEFAQARQESWLESSFNNILKDPAYQRCEFLRDDQRNKDVSEACRQYVVDFEEKLKAKYKDVARIRKGLMLFGATGTGKSFYAACIGNSLSSMGYKVLMTNLPKLSAEIGYDYIEAMKQLNRYDLLILDDWGIERKTEVMNEQIQTIIEERYRQELPIIITTNHTIESLMQSQDQVERRIFSRLCEMVKMVKVKGEDRRKMNYYLEKAKLQGAV